MDLSPLPDKPINMKVDFKSAEVKVSIDFGDKTPTKHLEQSLPALQVLLDGTGTAEFTVGSESSSQGTPSPA